ncbi:MAG: gamma-butyrobetaine hydroxylase-like domain-containing protein, partial [Acidimicrobiales bacterium]
MAVDLGVPAIWLRDNCPCPECRDPRSGQKLVRLVDLPEGLAVERVEGAGQDAGTVAVTFAPDGHRAAFPAAWLTPGRDALTAGRGAPAPGRTEAAKRLWSAADLAADAAGGPPEASWDRYRHDDGERLRLLRAVADLGVALVTGAPAEEGTVLDVAETFGFVRETNYGRL